MFVSSRQINFTGLILVVFALSVGFYIQYGLGFSPCVLCVIQRTCMIIAGIGFFASVIHGHNIKWTKRYLVFALVVVVIGLFAVGRQLYLQSLPHNEEAMCLPGLSFFWQTGEYFKAFQSLFTGTKECGQVIWRFGGLSLAAWSGLFLIGLFVLISTSLALQNNDNEGQ